MKKNGMLVFLSYFLILLLLAGCTTVQGSSSLPYKNKEAMKGTSSRSVSVLRFDDIPVPSGFRIIDSESFAFQNDLTRVALLKSIGNLSAEEVVLFYKEEMPMYNWKPINIIEYERRILNYEKGSEMSIVTIERQGRKTVLTIAISPKSKPMKVDVSK